MEGHWSIPDAAGTDRLECRIDRVVGAALDHVEIHAGDEDALAAGRVDKGQVHRGGHLAQKPERVEPAPFVGAVGPWQLNRPRQLIADPVQEVLDFRSR